MNLAEAQYVAEVLELLETEVPALEWRLGTHGLGIDVKFPFRGNAGPLHIVVGMKDPEYWAVEGRLEEDGDDTLNIVSTRTIAMRRKSPIEAVRAVVDELRESLKVATAVLQDV